MTTQTRAWADLRGFRRRLDDFRRNDDGTCALVVRAMEKFLTAADYPEPTLMRSHLEEAKAAAGDLLTDSVETLVKHSFAAQGIIRDFTDKYEGVVIEPDEQFDDLGLSMSRLVSSSLRTLFDLRDGALAIAGKHVEVPNAAKLDEHIAHWETVKANLVDRWPWTTSAERPPVDREMVGRSRAAFRAGGQFETIDALIERIRSE